MVPITDAERQVTVLPGDEMRHVCEYNSADRSKPTLGGYGSDEEMCETYFMVIPSGNVLRPFNFSPMPIRLANGDTGAVVDTPWRSVSSAADPVFVIREGGGRD